jgi:hypothetical protein
VPTTTIPDGMAVGCIGASGNLKSSTIGIRAIAVVTALVLVLIESMTWLRYYPKNWFPKKKKKKQK